MKASSLLLIWLVAGLALGSTPPAFAQNSGGSAYSIGGIDVDVVGPNTQVARMAGFRIAQRKAWPQLWSRLTGLSVAAAPRLSDAQLDGMVSGIESQGERFSATRYIARLGVVFDRSRASGYLGAASAGLHSPPMLLLPMLGDGSAPKLYQGKTPWLAAWVRFRDTVTPLDYVLASGSASDNMLLTGWQVHRPDRSSWRNILTRYDAVQVLTAEARLTRSFPGGPVTALFIARQGPDAGELGRFTMTAATPDGLDAMFDAAVRQIDEIYAIALRSGRLQSEPDLSMELAPLLGNGTYIGAPSVTAVDRIGAVAASVEAAIATPDSASAAAIEAELRRTPGVTAVTITSLSLGGTSRVLVGYDVARDSLEYALDGKGLRLTSENGLMVLRRRLPEDLPVPPPKPPVAKPQDGGETAPPEVRAIPSATPPVPPT